MSQMSKITKNKKHRITLKFTGDQILHWHIQLIRSGVGYKPTENVEVAIANLENYVNWQTDFEELCTLIGGEKKCGKK